MLPQGVLGFQYEAESSAVLKAIESRSKLGLMRRAEVPD
jgi:hypothetical protein